MKKGHPQTAADFKPGEYYYEIPDDMLERFMRLSTEKKLAWLEDYMRFTHAALTKKQKKIRDQFRRGEL